MTMWWDNDGPNKHNVNIWGRENIKKNEILQKQIGQEQSSYHSANAIRILCRDIIDYILFHWNIQTDMNECEIKTSEMTLKVIKKPVAIEGWRINFI